MNQKATSSSRENSFKVFSVKYHFPWPECVKPKNKRNVFSCHAIYASTLIVAANNMFANGVWQQQMWRHCMMLVFSVYSQQKGKVTKNQTTHIFVVYLYHRYRMTQINSTCHSCSICLLSRIARFMGPTWGQLRANRTRVGPMLAPWTLLSGFLCYGYVSNSCMFYMIHLYSSQCLLW